MDSRINGLLNTIRNLELEFGVAMERGCWSRASDITDEIAEIEEIIDELEKGDLV